MINNSKGVWFFGLAGSGKTFASNILRKKFHNSFIIDGHEVRKHISFDLGYSFLDREIQLERLFGLSQVVLSNKLYPICSSVLMTNKIFEKCKSQNIKVLKIDRSYSQIKKIRKIYALNNNVVGKDIEQPLINTERIFNDGTFKFEEAIIDLLNIRLGTQSKQSVFQKIHLNNYN